MTDVVLNWHLGSTFGWGILGLAVFSHWANDPDLKPVMGHPITGDALGLCDPLRGARLQAAIAYSNRVIAELYAAADASRYRETTLIDAVGNGFAPSERFAARNVGRCIFELTDLTGARAALAKYDALLTASHWNAALLEQATGREAKVILEGVDPSTFCPGPRSGLLDPAAFHIFSGGKLEFRKGQDLVLLAFRRFRERHPEAVLVTAWQSIWPRLSAGFRGRLPVAVEPADDGMLDIGKWVAGNGIDPRAVIDLGLIPNALLPGVLREMDVCVQPSRAEACTNLPVKEAMACAVPVIAAVNTGMRDLLEEGNCIPLTRQAPVRGPNPRVVEGWGESDVDEIVAALEYVYDHREQARQIGARSRAWLIEHDRTWAAHASALKAWLLAL